jgi:hypothetical protein
LFFGLSWRSITSISLHALHGLDLVLDLLDQPALDDLGELDVADAARQIDARPQHLPARSAVLPLVLPRHLGQLLLGLLRARSRLPHGLDLPQHFTLAVLELVLGQLVVREGDKLANRALVGLQLLAELDDLPRHHRRARNRLDDRELPALDAPRDFDLPLARQQGDGSHLAEVHPDRIVGLVEGTGRQVELELFAALGRAVEALLVAELHLVRVEHFDPRAAERVEQVVEFFR